MATFRGVDLFGSGPSQVLVGMVKEEVSISRFCGVNGEHHLTMGRPGREVTQEGTLTADGETELLSRWGALCDRVGLHGDLVDDLGWVYGDCLLMSCEVLGPRRVDAAGKYLVRYRLRYRQPTVDVS